MTLEVQKNEPSAPPSADYQCLKFTDSAKFLLFFDDTLRTNPQLSLHPWQIEVNQDLCLGRTRVIHTDGTSEITNQHTPSSTRAYKFALCAANGSGKDAFVIAPFALWFICCKIKAKVIITSASGNQLSIQTEHYINELAIKINKWSTENYGREIIKIRKRHYTCLLSGSVMHMFATDEKEKAEGHHPIAPGCDMAIIVNEAKSIKAEIFEALRRCTGYSHWLDVSSPGEPIGPFYQHYDTWPNKRRISYFDCPHHDKEEFEEDRRTYGEHSAFFRSKWLALFTFLGGRFVVSHQKLLELLKNQNTVRKIHQSSPIRVGIDIALSTNGDETVLSFWRGNVQIDQREFRIQDSTLLAIAIEQSLQKHQLPLSHAHIFADDGGVGRSVIDILNRKGWNINRVLNNSSSKNKKLYRNRGAQLWYKFSRLIEEGCLVFHNLKDERLFSQISARKYKETDAGIDKLTLQSKKDMMAEGLSSPDRADAAVLAFTDVSLEDFLGTREKTEQQSDESLLLPETREEQYMRLRREIKNYRMNKPVEKRGNAHMSINKILKNRRSLSWKSF